MFLSELLFFEVKRTVEQRFRTAIVLMVASFFVGFGFATHARAASPATPALSSASSQPTPRAARRIVSLAPSATEWVAALGLVGSLVGVTEQCDFPPEVGKIAKIGSFMRTSVEQVLLKHPTDVVAVEGLPQILIQKLSARGARVHLLKINRLSDFSQQVLLLGQALGADEIAKQWAEKFKILNAPADVRPSAKKVMLVVALQPLYVATPRSWLSELFERAGFQNALRGLPSFPSDVDFASLALESALSVRSDQWILFSEEQAAHARLEAQAMKLIERIQVRPRPELRILSADLFTRPGPRVLQALQMIQEQRR
jgi:ABC-type Fe3+-hydroxamate transport system substrate-binding protein